MQNNEKNSTTTLSPKYIRDLHKKANITFYITLTILTIISLVSHIIGAGLVHEFRLSEAEVLKEMNDSMNPELKQDEKSLNNLRTLFSKSEKHDINDEINNIENKLNDIEKLTEKDFTGIYGSIKGGIQQQERQVSKYIMRFIYNFSNFKEDIDKLNNIKNSKTKEHMNNIASKLTDPKYTKLLNVLIYILAPYYFILVKIIPSSLLNIFNTANIVTQNEEDILVKTSSLGLLGVGEVFGVNEIVVTIYNFIKLIINSFKTSFTIFKNNIFITLAFLSFFLFSLLWSYIALLITRTQNYLFGYSEIILPSIIGGLFFIYFIIGLIKLIQQFY